MTLTIIFQYKISTTRAFFYIRQVMRVLILGYKNETIKMPSSHEQWAAIMEGFETIGGIPQVCGAIDGSLIQVKRYDTLKH